MFKIVGVFNYLFVIFLNAFTDLGHKIIVQNTVFKVYDGSTQIVLTAIVNALVLLPFILIFSPTGFLSNKFAKNKIMKHSSMLAVFITIGITYSYYNGYFVMAFAMAFLLSLQSAIFGPAKYGYIKELVGIKFISQGNAAVQAVTTVAILGGIIFYTVLFEGLYSKELSSEADILKTVAPIGGILIVSSLFEWFLATKLPNKMTEPSKATFNMSKYLKGDYLRKNLKTTTRKKEIFQSIIALSLFWSISQVVLAVFGEYAKRELLVTNTIYIQGVMALAGIGIVFGSIMAAKFSKYFINMGLVGIGAVGITTLVFFIPLVHSMNVMALMFSLFGIFSGFLMVPLNARIQFLAPNAHLGTILAGNNFIQYAFMISFLTLTTIFAYYGMNSEILFYLMTLVGVYLSYITIKRYFVEIFWAIMQIFSSLRHKYNYIGLENIPQSGAVLLLSNHVSWVDWIIIQLPMKHHINYMMDKDIYNWKFFNMFFKKGEVMPLSVKASKDAFKEATKRLQAGKIVGLFPEGKISSDSTLGKFYKGYELIGKDYDGVIVPVFIQGMYGSFFSRNKANEAKPFYKRRLVNVYFSSPVSKYTQVDELKEIINSMKDKYEAK
ncbi:MFS transporter [Sulfurimonas sp.]|jgi:acyl-[acyl-carrier-protein]-phospholipid O-acyltransferase / long-chain-fatty-acid--[acyl-carrier-protein] ligase|uniref:MFS transporter n=1 Tax=Sulfurimonas sp. TaxID=2022749 RepID=UPI0025D0E633|nr:MFS transporter [Sulfurimonas sp.]MBT5935090.1 MFS transporter [Sulfurimonas sp.]